MDNKLLQKEDFLPGVGDLIVTKIHFGKKDGNLTKWVQSIPRGRFSLIIKDALRAYIHGDTSYKLPVYPPPENPKETVLKSISIGKADYDIYIYLYSIERYMRANQIKAILNHLLNGTPKPPIPKVQTQQPTVINTIPKNNKSQVKSSADRATKNKLKLLQISKMMDSEIYDQQ